MKKRNYYKALKLKEDANPDEIKQSYRKLALEYHPDRNDSPSAEERFKEINEAYSILSDPEKRREYDRFLELQSPFTNEESIYGAWLSHLQGALRMHRQACPICSSGRFCTAGRTLHSMFDVVAERNANNAYV